MSERYTYDDEAKNAAWNAYWDGYQLGYGVEETKPINESTANDNFEWWWNNNRS